MSYIQIWIHTVWVTKDRFPFFDRTLISKVSDHVREKADAHKIQMDYINGHKDHIHLLLKIKSHQCIAEITQLLKGDCSRWINENKLTNEEFSWQHGYSAVSVSPGRVPHTRNYIKNQWGKHEHLSLKEELRYFQEFMDDK